MRLLIILISILKLSYANDDGFIKGAFSLENDGIADGAFSLENDGFADGAFSLEYEPISDAYSDVEHGYKTGYEEEFQEEKKVYKTEPVCQARLKSELTKYYRLESTILLGSVGYYFKGFGHTEEDNIRLAEEAIEKGAYYVYANCENVCVYRSDWGGFHIDGKGVYNQFSMNLDHDEMIYLYSYTSAKEPVINTKKKTLRVPSLNMKLSCTFVQE